MWVSDLVAWRASSGKNSPGLVGEALPLTRKDRKMKNKLLIEPEYLDMCVRDFLRNDEQRDYQIKGLRRQRAKEFIFLQDAGLSTRTIAKLYKDKYSYELVRYCIKAERELQERELH